MTWCIREYIVKLKIKLDFCHEIEYIFFLLAVSFLFLQIKFAQNDKKDFIISDAIKVTNLGSVIFVKSNYKI